MSKRRYVRKDERALLRERQNNLCSCGCGQSLDSGPSEVEHTIPIWMDGPDELSNMTLMLASCHLIKTAKEAPLRAKVRRLQKRQNGERPKARRGRELKGGRRLESRGFPKNSQWKRKLNGKTVRREKGFDS